MKHHMLNVVHEAKRYNQKEVFSLSEHRLVSDNKRYNYMLLSRLKMDCEYFLRQGGLSERSLWSGSIEEIISSMKELWHSFSEKDKPEWLTLEEIEEFHEKMKQTQTRRKQS